MIKLIEALNKRNKQKLEIELVRIQARLKTIEENFGATGKLPGELVSSYIECKEEEAVLKYKLENDYD